VVTTSLAFVRDSVERFLRASHDDVSADAEGDLVVRRDGVAAWIRATEMVEGQTAVFIWSVPVEEPGVDDELTRYLATEGANLTFGHFELYASPDRVHLSHTLMGEHLSREELELAVDEVLLSTVRYGRIIEDRFGGRRPEARPARSAGPERPPPPAGKAEGIELLRARVEAYLKESHPGVSVDDQGDFALRSGSSVTWVRPDPWEGHRSLARVFSVTNVGVRVDGELTRFLLETNARLPFGGFQLDERRSATIIVHSLLGEYLNPNELHAAILCVSGAAEQFAREIGARFGGTLLIES